MTQLLLQCLPSDTGAGLPAAAALGGGGGVLGGVVSIPLSSIIFLCRNTLLQNKKKKHAIAFILHSINVSMLCRSL